MKKSPKIDKQEPGRKGKSPKSEAKPSTSHSLDQHILGLHKTIGNRAVGQLLQAKLRVSQPNGKYEQEADVAAEQAMRMPAPQVQRQVEEEEDEELVQTKPLAEKITPLIQREAVNTTGPEEEDEVLQTKSEPGQAPTVSPQVSASINAMRGGGQPLPEASRRFFEPRFGKDFSHVRVHTNNRAAETARSLDAKAFTVGRDVAFGRGQYAPENAEGKKLLAHELTHVVQQEPRLLLRKEVSANPLNQLLNTDVLEVLKTLNAGNITVIRALLANRGFNLTEEIEETLRFRKKEGRRGSEDIKFRIFKEDEKKGVRLIFRSDGLIVYGKNLYDAQGQKLARGTTVARILAERRKAAEAELRSRVEARLFTKRELKMLARVESLEPFRIGKHRFSEEQVKGLLQKIKLLGRELDLGGFNKKRNNLFILEDNIYKKQIEFLNNGLVYYSETNLLDAKRSYKIVDASGQLIEEGEAPDKESLLKKKRQKVTGEFLEWEYQVAFRPELTVSREAPVPQSPIRERNFHIWQVTRDRYRQSGNIDKGVTELLATEAFPSLLEALTRKELSDKLPEITVYQEEKQDLQRSLSELRKKRRKAKGLERERYIKEIKEKRQALKETNRSLKELRRRGEIIKQTVKALKYALGTAREKKKIYPELTKEKSVEELAAGELARKTAAQLCNGISYFLFGKIIGHIPEDMDVVDWFISEVKAGHIGVQKPLGGSLQVSGVYYGWGSLYWTRSMGAISVRKKRKGTKRWLRVTHRSIRGEFRRFLTSSATIAITHQDTGKGRPTHFLLIVKDENGDWRNLDHASGMLYKRGGYTNFEKVHGITYFENDAILKQIEIIPTMRGY